MKRRFGLLFSLACLVPLLGSTPLASAQSAAVSGNNPPPSDVVGTNLIAWSELQKPKPIVESRDALEPGKTAQPAKETDSAAKQPNKTEGDVQSPNPQSCSSNMVEPEGR
jgi:hypothetical protein